MTLKQIKAMFTVGSRWTLTRLSPQAVIYGNLGNTPIQPETKTENRTVARLASECLVTTTNDRTIYTTWPKASEVMEASDGHLKFQYADGGVTCYFSKLS